jgi:regulatory protein YycI of two-component signal transduction system YycFG
MKKSTKRILIVALVILILLLFLVLINYNTKIISYIIRNSEHSYTKALCNENNYCKDYEIKCLGKKSISLTPTTFAVQQDENWKDFRNEDEICRD